MNDNSLYKITYTDSFDWHVYVVASSQEEAIKFARANMHDLEYDEEEMSRSGPFIESIDRNDSDYERCNEYIDYCKAQHHNSDLCMPYSAWLRESE